MCKYQIRLDYVASMKGEYQSCSMFDVFPWKGERLFILVPTVGSPGRSHNELE